MAEEIQNPFGDILKVPELKRRILFTLAIIAAYRVGATIPVPGVNAEALRGFFAQQQNTLLGFLNIFSGGAMGRLAIFAMGVGPYINASIIISLLQGAHVIPYLDRLAKEGEQGRKRLTQITRYLTLGLAGLQSFGLALSISKFTSPHGQSLVADPTAGWIAITVLTLTTGSVFIMWLGEQVSERGIGNGMSLIIFAGIVVGLPRAADEIYINVFQTHQWTALHLIIILAVMVGVVAFIVLVERGERRIPVQYAKRVVGRGVMGGQATHLPLKVNAGGVMPVIFASSILTFPQTFTMVPWVKNSPWLMSMFGCSRHSQPLYVVLYVALIMFFAFFYVSIIFNPNEAADNMRKYGGFIPGHRPGEKNPAEE